MYPPHNGVIGLLLRALPYFTNGLFCLTVSVPQKEKNYIHHSFSFHSSTMFVTISATSQIKLENDLQVKKSMPWYLLDCLEKPLNGGRANSKQNGRSENLERNTSSGAIDVLNSV